jgi:uncharacterized protein RhaS with RHS repeats
MMEMATASRKIMVRSQTIQRGFQPVAKVAGATVKNFTYDAAGNLTGNGSVTFTHDGRGRLSQVSNGYKYSINGVGQRVAKSGPAVATGTLHFVYDEQGHLIGEYDAAGTVRQEIVYLGDTPVASVRVIARVQWHRHLSDLQRPP